MTDHAKGLLIVVVGVLFIVPDSLFVRLIQGDPATVAFWRCLTAGTLILFGLLVTGGLTGFRQVLSTGRLGGLYTLLLGGSSIGFVLAVSWTSVANVVFILASMPVFAALFSRFFLNEAISRRMIFTLIGVFMGLGFIFKGSQDVAVAHWSGDLLAVLVSATFAGTITTARRLRSVSLVPLTPMALIGAALVILPLSSPMVAWHASWPLILAHGFCISLSTTLLTLGPRYLAPPEVALLILLESVLAPLLVWAVVGEYPGTWALFGGSIVILVLLVSNLIALRQSGLSKVNQ